MVKKYPLKDADKATIEKIAQGVLNTYSLQHLTGLSAARALENEVSDLWALTEGNDSESLTEVRRRRGLSTSLPDESLMPTVFELDNGLLALAHVCRNHSDETLIEIFSDQVIDKSFLQSFAPLLLTHFSWSQAKYFDVWHKPNSQTAHNLLSMSGSKGFDCFVAASKNLLNLSTSNQLALVSFDLDKHWSWYEAEYKAFHIQRPELCETVEIEDPQDIEEAIAAGLCDVAYLNQEPIAMIMAEDSEELGCKGLLFRDILVAAKFRGKGYGAEVQRTFIKKHYAKYELFSGFIDTANIASLRNAAKQGREILRQEICVPTEHFK